MDIKIGDVIELRDFDSGEIIFEKVTNINNPNSNDFSFQIKTRNLEYDFTNFYEIINVYKPI